MYKKFNDKVGNMLSNGLSTMELFYVVLLLVLIPLLVERPSSLIGWIQYISTTILQAVALPLLGYTTKTTGDVQAKLLQETHDNVMNELNIAKEERQDLQVIMSEIKEILEEK